MTLDDQASDAEERIREGALADQRARAAKETQLPSCGVCYYCSEPVEGDKVFHDSFCRDGFEELRRARIRNGG